MSFPESLTGGAADSLGQEVLDLLSSRLEPATFVAASPDALRSRVRCNEAGSFALGSRFVGKNVDALVSEFGPPASTFAFSIDGSAPIFAKAIAITTELAGVKLADSSELFARFRRGNMLQVSSANQVFSFSLDGTSALLPALLACVRQETTPVVAQTNPFAAQQQQAPTQQQAPKQAQPSRDLLQAEATLTAANILGAAGIEKFSLGSLEEAAKLKAEAIWTAGALVGTVKIAENVKLDNPEIPSILIGDDAKTCSKGAFLSGSLPDSDSKEMLRIFTSCQQDKKNWTTYYLAVPRPKGGIYLFSTMSDGPQEAVKEADSGLRTAVFKSVR
jgi:hypothetical protein